MMGNLYNQPDTYLEGQEETAVIDTLDNYIRVHNLPAPNLIKVDIECAEVDFLYGAEQTIKAHSPLMLIEFHTLPLLKRGYEILTGWGFSFRDENGRDLTLDELNHFNEATYTRETFFISPSSTNK
jgi:hypothetical protein